MRITKYHFLLVIVVCLMTASVGFAQNDTASKADSPLRVLTRPRPEFPEEAKKIAPNFSVVMLVEFREDNTIGEVVCVVEDNDMRKKLADTGVITSLTEAAKKITFEAQVKDGEAITVKKRIEYSFAVY